MSAFRVCFDDGDVEVEADDADEAERKARFWIHQGSRDTTVQDRGEVWSVIDLSEFPDSAS